MKRTLALSILALTAAVAVGCSNKSFPNNDTEVVHTTRFQQETKELATNYCITLADAATSAQSESDTAPTCATPASTAAGASTHTVPASWGPYRMQQARALLYNIVSHAERLQELNPQQTVVDDTTIADARAWLTAINLVLEPPPKTTAKN